MKQRLLLSLLMLMVSVSTPLLLRCRMEQRKMW